MNRLKNFCVVVLGLVSVAACSSTGDSNSPSGTSSGASGNSSGTSGSAPVTQADCSTRCQTKGTSCQAPSEQISQACAQICGGGATAEQMTCLEGKSCSALAAAESIDELCPGSSSGSSGTSGTSGSSGSSGGGGTKELGQACACTGSGVTPGSEGLCSGTNVDCKSGLSCLYRTGSNGKGVCVGKRCCDSKSACDKDPSLLKPCDVGSCTLASSLGYFCTK